MAIGEQLAMMHASGTVHTNGYKMRDALCHMLDIDRDEPGWQEKLQPYAGVWAAMIAATAQHYDTACKTGGVEDTLANVEMNRRE